MTVMLEPGSGFSLCFSGSKSKIYFREMTKNQRIERTSADVASNLPSYRCVLSQFISDV